MREWSPATILSPLPQLWWLKAKEKQAHRQLVTEPESLGLLSKPSPGPPWVYIPGPWRRGQVGPRKPWGRFRLWSLQKAQALQALCLLETVGLPREGTSGNAPGI